MRRPQSCLITTGVWTVVILSTLLSATSLTASTAKVLHTFQGGKDGANPIATLFLDTQGNLYGTTEYGGTPDSKGCEDPFIRKHGCGTVFSLTPSGDSWQETVLHRFLGGAVDGSHPRGSLLLYRDGNFYSTTSTGGSTDNGTVFSITPGAWTVHLIFSFDYHDGAYPQCGLVADAKGNLYGATPNGGNIGPGAVFELTPNRGNTQWTETVIHNFSYTEPDGAVPWDGVFLDSKGKVYVTTPGGGVSNGGGVYQFVHSKSGWTENIVNLFSQLGGNGIDPYAQLISDQNGNLYGTTSLGGLECGQFVCGIVYELTHSGGHWNETILYRFQGGTDGSGAGDIIFDKSGNLYGVTEAGGQYGFGTVYKLSPVNGVWQETIIYSFLGGAGGAFPIGGLIMDQQGNIFGTTYFGGAGGHCGKRGCGVVFEITP